MCLRSKQTNYHVADKDIKVYKVAVRRNWKYYAPFRRSLYVLDTVLYSLLREDFYKFETIVEDALHSIETFDEAVDLAKTQLVHNSIGKPNDAPKDYVVLEAIIPKGSHYYKGSFSSWSSYASNKLIILSKGVVEVKVDLETLKLISPLPEPQKTVWKKFVSKLKFW